jgi:hypothetical protein
MSSHTWTTAASASALNSNLNKNHFSFGFDVIPNKTIKIQSIAPYLISQINGYPIYARIYNATTGALVVSGGSISAASGSSYYVIPITATLVAGTKYRIVFYWATTALNLIIGVGYNTGTITVDTATLTIVSSGGYSVWSNGSNGGDTFPNTYSEIGDSYIISANIVGNAIEPNKPTNLSPAGTSGAPSAQVTLIPTLSWLFTDPDMDGTQSAYQVVIKKASDNSIVKDTGKVASSSNTYTVPAGTLQSGTLYYWTVDVWDNADLKNSTSPTAQYFKTISQPTISGNANEDLGNKNTPFAVMYSVNDADSTDVLNVVEKLNGSQINTISNAPRNTNFTINITQEILNSLTLNQQNTIQISVTDGYSTTYKNITFTRVNSGPSITNNDKDLGQVAREGIAEKYTCHDVEGNTFTIVEKVNDIEIKNTAGVDGTEYTINIPLNIWLALRNGAHTYTITATDSLGASSTRTFTFTKKETAIESTGLAKIIQTDIAATKILLTPNWIGKENADTILFQVCNNAFDINPTWEDATSQTLLNKPYVFTNKVKTATKWGIDIKFKITLKSGATEGIEFYGLGGSLE